MNHTHPFPWRELFAHEMLGWSTVAVADRCGDPYNAEGNIWTYRHDRDPSNLLGDPDRIEVQLWFEGPRLAHAWITLEFHEQPYHEVLF